MMKERPRGKPLSRGSAARTTQVHVGSRPHGAGFRHLRPGPPRRFRLPLRFLSRTDRLSSGPRGLGWPDAALRPRRRPLPATRFTRSPQDSRSPTSTLRPLRTALPLPTNEPSSHPAFSVHLSIFQKTNFNITAYKDFLNLQKLNPSSTFDTTQRSRALRLPPPAPLGQRTAPCAHEALRDCSVDDWVGAEADGTTYCEARKQADRHALI